MLKLAESFLWNIWAIMNFLFSKWYMKKDDSIAGMLHTLYDNCLCHSTVGNKYKHMKKSISSYQRLNKPPTKSVFANLSWSFRSKRVPVPQGLLTHHRNARAQSSSFSSSFRIVLAALTMSWGAWKRTQGYQVFLRQVPYRHILPVQIYWSVVLQVSCHWSCSNSSPTNSWTGKNKVM